MAPAAAARQWTDRLGRLVLLAGVFGALGGLSGAVVSSLVPRLPTGPTIVLSMSAITILSLLAAPRRGVLPARWRMRQQRRSVRADAVLLDLYRLAAQHADPLDAPHSADTLRTMRARAYASRGNPERR